MNELDPNYTDRWSEIVESSSFGSVPVIKNNAGKKMVDLRSAAYGEIEDALCKHNIKLAKRQENGRG